MLIKNEIIQEMKQTLGQIQSQKAQEYVEENLVTIEGIQFNWNNTSVLVNATVNETMHKKNQVAVRINIEEKYLYGNSCSCLGYSYRDCEHILAVLIELNRNTNCEREIKNRLEKAKKEEDKRIFKTIISNFADILQSEEIIPIEETVAVEDNCVKIVPIMKKEKYGHIYNLSFKIGYKKMYKIKDLSTFYQAYIKEQNYCYGEGLSFKHNEQAFAKEARKILPFILKYGEAISYANNILEENERYSKVSTSNIRLEDGVIDEFFEIIKKQKINLEIGKEKKMLEIMPEKEGINFKIEKIKNDEYKLSPKKADMIYFEGLKNIYLIEDNKLYECNKQENHESLTLLKMYNQIEKTEITFEKEELINFVNIVVPRIRKNLDLSGMPKTEIEEYIPKKIATKIFLDLDEKGNILAKVKFCYGEIEFNPMQDKPLIPREIFSERKILTELKTDGFHYIENKQNFLLKEETKIYEFLTTKINTYMEKYEVLISEDFKKKQIKQPKIPTLGVRIQNDLLNIDFSGLEYDPKELQEIIEKYKLRKKYHRLKDGTFLTLEQNENMDFIEDLTEGLEINYKDIAKGRIKIPVNRSLYLNKLLEKIPNTEINEDKSYKELIENTENCKKDEEIAVPAELEIILRTYQKTGYKWLKILDRYKFGGILADDMGLGKTLQIIAIILEEKQKNKERKPSIVVCPSSLSLNWKNEIEKFANKIDALVINGNNKERREKISRIENYDIVITSYDLLKRDIDIYNEKELNFRYIIADEAQYIKNSNTQNAKSLKELKGETRYALTGTPIENSLSELWSIFDYIMPGYLFTYSKFKREYETKIIKDEDEVVMKRLKTMIEPFILRRIKKEVLTELPDKTITILKNEMEGEQQKLYLSYLAQTKKEIMQEIKVAGFEKSQIKILSLLTRLRQICCHPALFLENYQGESNKLNQCLEILEEAISGGHKILLFSTYTSMFKIIEKELEKRDINYFKLTGQTKVDERIDMVDEFNKSKNVKVFLISLKAGGTGLNLTGADFVIHYDPWWNLSAENQATDRAYRIGQKNNVQVYKLITKNSIEEKINELQNKKGQLIDNVLDTNQTFVSKLSKEDIMSLFEG